MTIKFPNDNKVYIQNNRSKIFPKGNLWSTFGLDFQSNLGVMRVSPRMRINSQVSGLANLGVPTAFKYFAGAFRTVAGARLFNGGATPNAAFTQDAATGTPTDCNADSSDLEVFNGKLWVTTNDELLRNGSSGSYGDWTTVTALSSSVPHILRYFPQFNRLYVTNSGTGVGSVDTANAYSSTGDYTLSLPFGNLIMAMEATSDTIWIGTQSRDVDDMNANIFQWDGISAQATNVYPISAKAVLAISIDEDTGLPYIIDSNGIFQAFNGSGFEEVGRLPYTSQLPYNPDGFGANKFIHFNGLSYTPDGTFLALINNLNNDSGATINENIASGLWEWSKDINFTHKYPFTYNAVGSSTITDYGQNRISRAGGLAYVRYPDATAGQYGIWMAGAAIYTNASSTTNAIFIDDSLDVIQKKGYFVTDWFESKEIADKWMSWFMSFRRFLDSGDNFTLKYRNIEEAPVEAAITWVNTTSFTVLNSAVVVSNYWTTGTGGEVEITRGTGGASCVHITNAVNNAGTWTVTIDEAVTGVTTGTATARFQKWIKVFPAESLASPRNYANFTLNETSEPRIQFKGCFTLTGQGEFYKSIITSSEDIKALPQ